MAIKFKLKLFKKKKINKSQISVPYESSSSDGSIEEDKLLTGQHTDSYDSESNISNATVLIHQFDAYDGNLVNSYKYNSFSIEKDLQSVVKTNSVSMTKLIQSINTNRSKFQLRYYIYDKQAFEGSILKDSKEPFDIFAKPNGINHKSCRYVLHSLTKNIKEALEEGESELHAMDFFAPNLQQLDRKTLWRVKFFINELFPRDGCSLKGNKLESLIASTDLLIVVISTRLILSLLPGGILSWACYEEFTIQDAAADYHPTNFYNIIPKCLPSINHPHILQEFLDLVVLIWSNTDLGNTNLYDLLYVASSICFKEPRSFNDYTYEDDDDYKDIYYKKQYYCQRNLAFQRLFSSYLRNILHEGKVSERLIPTTNELDLFRYPPNFYQTEFVEYGLVVSVPKHKLESEDFDFGDIVRQIGASKASAYSFHPLFFDESMFLEKLCAKPYETLSANVSDLSLEYLSIFDRSSTLYDKIKHHDRLFTEVIEEDADNSFSMEDSVKVSKIVISEWFFNTWKQETLMGKLKSTFIFELKQKIGQISWLVITTDDNARCEFLQKNGGEFVDPEMTEMMTFNGPASPVANGDHGMFTISEAEELLNNQRKDRQRKQRKEVEEVEEVEKVEESGEYEDYEKSEIKSIVKNRLTNEPGEAVPNNLKASEPTFADPNELRNVEILGRTFTEDEIVMPQKQKRQSSASSKKRRHSERDSVQDTSSVTMINMSNDSVNATAKTVAWPMNIPFDNAVAGACAVDDSYMPLGLKTSPRCSSLKSLAGKA